MDSEKLKDKSSATISPESKAEGKVIHLKPPKPTTEKTTADLPRPKSESQTHYNRLLQLARLLDVGKDKKLVITGLRMIANDLERVQLVKDARKVKKSRRGRA